MEPQKSVFGRAIQGLKHYVSMYSYVNILIVTHGAVLKALVDNQGTYPEADITTVKSVPGGLFKLDLSNEGHHIEEIKVNCDKTYCFNNKSKQEN